MTQVYVSRLPLHHRVRFWVRGLEREGGKGGGREGEGGRGGGGISFLLVLIWKD